MLPASLALGLAPARRADAAFIVNPSNGHYYGLTNTAETFTAAEAEAVALGGHLAAVADSSENDFLVNTFLTASQATSVPYWIGFTDAAVEGTFVWTSGEPVTYTNWQPGEPNNFGGNENYTAIGWHFARGESALRGTWNDVPLNGTLGFGGNSDGPYHGIIELTFNPSAAPVPEPSSILLAASGVGLLGFNRLRRRSRAA